MNREEYEEAMCYVGKPRRYGKDTEMPGPPGMVFTVYVTKDFKVFEWRWEQADEQDADCPHDALRRFKKVIWKR